MYACPRYAMALMLCASSLVFCQNVIAEDQDNIRACDLAAASPEDSQRPSDIPGVEIDKLVASTDAYSSALTACEDAATQAPGNLRIDIFRLNGSIEFCITDDGIGIENSLMNKDATDSHISKGMQITSGRIDLIRKMTDLHIELHGPYQLHDASDQPSGTRVRIVLPVNFHELFPN